MDEFRITRKLLSGAAMLNHGAEKLLCGSIPSAKFRITFKLQKLIKNYSVEFGMFIYIINRVTCNVLKFK